MATNNTNHKILPQRSKFNPTTQLIVNKAKFNKLKSKSDSDKKMLKQSKRQRRNARRALAKPLVRGNKRENGWLTCRLQPFMAKGLGLQIPDGNTNRAILLDHRTIDTFTFGDSGSIYIVITPNIPASIFWSGGVNSRVNGTLYPYNYQLFRPISLREWNPMPVQLHNSAGNFDYAGQLFTSAKLRIATVGWRIRYTGSDMNNSGLIKVNTSSNSAEPPQPNTTSFTCLNSQGASDKTWSENQVQIRRLATDFQFDKANSQETQVIPLKYGAHGILRHNAPDYEFTNITNNLTFLTVDYNETQSFITHVENLTPETVCQHWPHSAAYDPGWSCTMINISGGSPGSSFVLDTIYCIEYIPTTGSDVYSLGKIGPPANPAVLKAAADAARVMPVASPALDTAISAVSTAAKVASTIAPFIV